MTSEEMTSEEITFSSEDIRELKLAIERGELHERIMRLSRWYSLDGGNTWTEGELYERIMRLSRYVIDPVGVAVALGELYERIMRLSRGQPCQIFIFVGENNPKGPFEVHQVTAESVAEFEDGTAIYYNCKIKDEENG